MQRCEVFFGAPIEDRYELRFLRRVRADLERRDCAARVLANFMVGRDQRQVDFLISTRHRLVHVELKTADPALPLLGGANGAWEQQLPDGRRRSLERNYYRQAHSTTQAISDDMHDLARAGDAPRRASKFYTDIHTVICVNPGVPAGSRLQPYRYVDVLGYEELLELLCTDGPRLGWSNEHWSAFIRHLQLMPESINGEDERHRVSRETVEDYQRRFVAARSRELKTFVALPARRGEAIVSDPVELLERAAQRSQTMVLLGPSGTGKTFMATRAAIMVATSGGIPVWVRCDEYQGRLSHALSRAVAPFTTQAALPLLHTAADLGFPIAVFLDGFNECAPADRQVLLEQLDALRLRLPSAVVITSTEPVDQSDEAAIAVEAMLPDEDGRRALVAAYGAQDAVSGLEAFQTPMELSMAAECGESLRPGATSTELYDAYITRLCSSETTRAGLRRLASQMDAMMRGSLTIAEVRLLLRRAKASDGNSIDMDAVLRSPLMTAVQGRAAFTHESLGRFLTAEQLVLDADDGHMLAEALRDVRRTDLPTHVVALEIDAERRRDLLFDLANVKLLRAAARGEFGADTAHGIVAKVGAELAQAAARVNEAQLIDVASTPEGLSRLYWANAHKHSDLDLALLRAAGECLADGVFVDDVAALLDATDRRCADEMRRLRAGGNRRSISTVVEATYGGAVFFDDRERRQLPASVVVKASEFGWRTSHRPLLLPSPARRLWEYGGQPRWGRLTAALRLVNPDDPADVALLPDLFEAAWKVTAYHLRLAALDTALWTARQADETTRRRMQSLLEECDKDNIMLNSLLFEVLAAYDGLEPLKTHADIRAEIAEILAAPNDPHAWEAAQHMIGMPFEDQRLHGPYAEVISSLDGGDQLRLHVMAGRNVTSPMYRDTVMQVIVIHLDRITDDARDVLRDAILKFDWENPFPHEAIRAHLIAIYGWAKLADRLPPALSSDSDLVERSWRIVDELLFAAFKGIETSSEQVTALWTELLGPNPSAAIDAVAQVRSAGQFGLIVLNPTPYAYLLSVWPEQMRQLIEWCVKHPTTTTQPFDKRRLGGSRHELIQDLAQIGTEDSATLLQAHLQDPEIGLAAVHAIRAIRARTQQRPEPA
ncbi:hypothetical protein GCM10020358_67720 [Amorphoplanes nipponensis]|uniref:NERD domain-containing protein n=1 Tax=Actinoplanes nipponensis TaxID=135950 RepID=A0A919MVX0_9ACTN|nr:NERD domain-containing protein [Actinoplanes nipponensis]GIE51605.1 hypothetical protein Ani05nite_51390 [Actinoplanes nipponensis]